MGRFTQKPLRSLKRRAINLAFLALTAALFGAQQLRWGVSDKKWSEYLQAQYHDIPGFAAAERERMLDRFRGRLYFVGTCGLLAVGFSVASYRYARRHRSIRRARAHALDDRSARLKIESD